MAQDPPTPNAHPAAPLALVVDAADVSRAVAVAKALASEPRWRLLRTLGEQLCNVGELAEALAMPPSTVAMHLAVLEQAGLVRTEYVPGRRGRQRVCQRVYDQVRWDLPRVRARAARARTRRAHHRRDQPARGRLRRGGRQPPPADSPARTP